MRVLILGRGMLAQELMANELKPVDVVQYGRNDVDITNSGLLKEKIEKLRPDVVVNATAYTLVDKAEESTEEAYAVNRDAVRNLAEICSTLGCRLVHISTDFVFDGEASSPYSVGDKKNPLGVYGASKSEGEDCIIAVMKNNWTIVRTSWLYSVYGNNFVKTMLALMSERDELAIVNDQIGAPTWAEGLSRCIWTLIKNGHSGMVHWADLGEISWYEFAQAIYEKARELKLLKKDVVVKPVSTQEFAAKAPRPGYSVLKVVQLEGMPEPESWKENLALMLSRLASEPKLNS